MVGVDGGDDERDERVLAVVLRVREDGDIGLDEFHLCNNCDQQVVLSPG